MKNIYLFILLIGSSFVSTLAIGQSDLEAIDPQTIVIGTTEDLLLTNGFDIRNNSDGVINVKVRRFILEEVPGTYNYFCWEQCYTPAVSISPTSIPIGAGQSVSNFYADYQPYGNVGTTIVEYCFYDENDFSNQTCVTIEFQVSTASSVEDASVGKIGLPQPNPSSTGIVSFQYELNQPLNSGNITIYNLIGQEVKKHNLVSQEGLATINIGDLNAGLYMYSFINDGKRISTGKLIVR